MNFIQKIKNFIYYKNILNKYKDELYELHGIKIDYIYRMYKYYTIDEKEYLMYGGDKPILHDNSSIENVLNNMSSSGKLMNGEQYFESTVSQKLSRLDSYLMKIGLSEMYGLTSKKRINIYTYKVIIEFKYIKTLFWANMSLILGISTIIGIIIGVILGIFLIFI